MRVLHAAVECLPFATTGGLGDVLGALPAALRRGGCDARIMLPAYGFIPAALRQGPAVAAFEVLGRRVRIREAQQRANGAPVYLCEIPELFDRGIDPYRDVDGREYPDNPLRFLAFCEAVLRFAEELRRRDRGYVPDILHLHDWHTALIAARLRQLRAPLRSVLSIHNLAFQGRLSHAEFRALGLDETIWRAAAEVGADHGSWMRAGIVASDAVITVSPSYAREIRTPAEGCGLDTVLRARAAEGRLHGIVNGIDDVNWNPQKDPALVRNYGLADVRIGKQANRRALQQELGLAAVERPLVVFVGRLTGQKGADLLVEAGPALLKLDAQYVFIGVGEETIASGLRWLADASPQLAFRSVHDASLARRAIAAADLLLMPSRFEPCGMTQLYAQRYGTVPVARRTGGLCDTIVDASGSTLVNGTATGVHFNDADVGGLLYGVRRGLELVQDAVVCAALRHAAMSRDLSWNGAADRYRHIYRGLLQPTSSVRMPRATPTAFIPRPEAAHAGASS